MKVDTKELNVELHTLLRKLEVAENYGCSTLKEAKKTPQFKTDSSRVNEIRENITTILTTISQQIVEERPLKEVAKMEETDKKAQLKQKRVEYKELINQYRETLTKLKELVEAKKAMREELKTLQQ